MQSGRVASLGNVCRVAAWTFQRPLVDLPLCGAAVRQRKTMSTPARVNGDLNNTEVLRRTAAIVPDPAWACQSLAIPEEDDNLVVRSTYRPFLLDETVERNDWISTLELSTVLQMVDWDLAESGGERIKVLVLFGSLRSR